MKISDIIRGVLDLIDGADQESHEHVVVVPSQQTHDDDAELVRMRQIAGLLDHEPSDTYENEPNEKYAGVDSVISGGDDVHKEKHPLDLRGNSISLYQP